MHLIIQRLSILYVNILHLLIKYSVICTFISGDDNVKNNIIITGTITYAIRGRDVLRKNGIRASVERNLSGNKRFGCGYGIAVHGDIDEAVRILKEHGVKILDIAPEI